MFGEVRLVGGAVPVIVGYEQAFVFGLQTSISPVWSYIMSCWSCWSYVSISASGVSAPSQGRGENVLFCWDSPPTSYHHHIPVSSSGALEPLPSVDRKS